jgi:hypothetical protein
MENRLTLFVAADPDLDACFPGWRLPLPEPRSVEQVNPFTKELVTFKTWDPGRAPGAGAPRSIRSARRRKSLAPILPPEGDGARWLEEEDTPALLRTLPHFAMWAVSIWPLRELLATLDLPAAPPCVYGSAFDVPGCAPPARIVDCPEEEGTIDALPEGVAGPLAALDDRGAKRCLAAWQKALDIRGKSVKRIEEEFAEGSTWALRRIRALAAEADRRGGNIFVSSRT